ncbi:MAG: DUF948 domain-containing protein [Limnothrix sp.]
MQDPFFWLLLSFLLVAISLTAVLAASFPAFLELGRVARSAEKLLDTLNHELPRTLEALRRAGGELAELGEDIEGSIKSAKGVIQQTEKGMKQTQHQIKQVHHGGRSTWVGLKTTWKELNRSKSKKHRRRR